MTDDPIPVEEREPAVAPPRCPECWTILDTYPASRRDLEFRCPEHGVIDAPAFGRRLEVVR